MRVPALNLDATVTAVGVEEKTGDFDVPPSVDRVGWYRFGPGTSATKGSIVIAGHVDSAAQGKGAFFRLGSLSPGDRIFLDDREFRVIGRERYAKTKIPLDKYFARDGGLRLTLITCGGPFDASTGHYRDNVVVTATPVEVR
jgi:sortase (surface protein transpeptidase)